MNGVTFIRDIDIIRSKFDEIWLRFEQVTSWEQRFVVVNCLIKMYTDKDNSIQLELRMKIFNKFSKKSSLFFYYTYRTLFFTIWNYHFSCTQEFCSRNHIFLQNLNSPRVEPINSNGLSIWLLQRPYMSMFFCILVNASRTVLFAQFNENSLNSFIVKVCM